MEKGREQPADKPYDAELAEIGESLSRLDPETAREVLDELSDIAEALASEQASEGKDRTSLAAMYRRLGLER